MQIFQHLITPAILVPLFFITTFVTSLATPDPISLEPYTYNWEFANKDSTPDCAASSTVIVNLPYEFWIEVVFLEPPLLIDGSPLAYRPGNPLRIVGGIGSPSGAFYDGVFIAETFLPDGSFDVRELFKLEKNFLYDSGAYARLWLGTNDDEPDSDFLSFNYVGEPRLLPDFVALGAVKVCNSKNETELQLRGQRSENSPDGMCVFFFFFFFFLGLPSPWVVLCRKTKRTWKHSRRRIQAEERRFRRIVALLIYFEKDSNFPIQQPIISSSRSTSLAKSSPHRTSMVRIVH